MYKILIHNIDNKYEYDELIKVFLPPEQFESFTDSSYDDGSIYEAPCMGEGKTPVLLVFNEADFDDKNAIKREIFGELSQITGNVPPWGILTGVRPVKLTGEIFDRLGSEEMVRRELKEEYLVSCEKIDLLLDTYKYQRKICGSPKPKSVGLYIGIPFCPTRCLYCSFTSNQVPEAEISMYLEALKKEIVYVGKRMKDTGLWPESIYIGGGTPTTLTAEQLDDLLGTVEKNINLERTVEFTVEAGRPDTITYDKLEVINRHGVQRISINPQSMKEHTLELIGRSHKPEDITEAFQIAGNVGIPMVNADIIAGLPEETPEDFVRTLEKILALAPANITVHTLAVKRASRLVEADRDYHYLYAKTVGEMLGAGKKILAEAGYRPYYLYRQKHMAGAFENVGYCREETPCIYNIRIMEEHQSILALGAGGISKMYYPEENRLERVPNVSNYEIYISRLDEMLERKEKNIFMEVERGC